ncbi:hypothetical protein GCM10010967_47230 [Dyadobacter beijingensis]|uniref:Uncharacterized protein n=1 Tax=Dyadobacter beijingensis TaxID=365489 RepID=A0ABQ2IFU9_9BACT|nr:hypothetical protein [Dyadobacter beijingensis]GGN06527.1 hypothetical protein GCM10010967_47230 [Dyadobacter beijingensis]
MENKIEINVLFETLLSSPGMNEQVKLDMKLTRKAILALAAGLQTGIAGAKQTPSSLLFFSGEAVTADLAEFTENILSKAGLTDVNQKLQLLTTT